MPSCPTITNYVTGITLQTLSADTFVPTTSGYTYATPMRCFINAVSSVPLTTILNDFTLLVIFGNGEIQEITQPTDSFLITEPVVYNWPGTYEVKLSVIPKNGCPLGTFTEKFSAFNYVVDSINWNYSEWPELTNNALASGALFHGFQSCVPGNIESPRSLKINYTTAKLVSTNLNFNLYSENSLSQPWKISTTNNKYAQLRPRWRFTDLSGNYIENLKDEAPSPVYIDSTGTQQTTGTLVGFTGSISFRYIDDIPSLKYTQGTGWSIQTPRLWVTYETFDIPNLQDNNDGNSPSYSNSKLQLSAYYYVKNLSAEHLNFSLNGGNIPLPNVLWPSTNNEFIISVNSKVLSAYEQFSNKALLNYPLQNITGQTVTVASFPLSAVTISAPVFTLSRYNNLNQDIGGYYKIL